jgi:hypothetical protein
MAQLATSPISPKMFRHFAAVTIVVTLLLAVFADGESGEALAENVSDEIAARREANRVEAEQVAKFGAPKLIQRNPQRRNSRSSYPGGDGFDADYGDPTDRTGQYSRTTAVWRGRLSSSAKMPSSYAPYGIPQAEWNAMSGDERQEFLRKRMPLPTAVSAEQHRRDVEGLLAASAARAGESGQDDE